ncbi:MAG: phosphoglycerate dehydrogenase, partial [Actinomycetales bacterium]|nr:phosphoglycerate dehydrogenase [Actinomycetales bacterium]
IATTHIVMEYTDRPGIVAIYGREFGEAGINIAGMQVSRAGSRGAEALVVLDLDESVDREFADELGAAIDARSIHAVDLVY